MLFETGSLATTQTESLYAYSRRPLIQQVHLPMELLLTNPFCSFQMMAYTGTKPGDYGNVSILSLL